MVPVNNEFIEKWEPFIRKFLQNKHINGYTDEELLQEMRIEIFRAANYFNPDRGFSFATLLYQFMTSRFGNLLSHSLRRKTMNDNTTYFDESSEYRFFDETLRSSIKTNDRTQLKYHETGFEDFEIFKEYELTGPEALLADLKMCGYKNNEIKKMCSSPKEFNKVWKSLKDKLTLNGKTTLRHHKYTL